MDDELILDDSQELEEVIPEPETAPEEIQEDAQFYKGDPFKYSDFTPEQLEALKVKGDPGRGIASIDLTSTNGKIKTYTITFTDNTTTTYTVIDGDDGEPPVITFVGTVIYVNGVAGPDLKGATGKSAYQSYLDTTTDNPPLSEAEWVVSLQGVQGAPGTNEFFFKQKTVVWDRCNRGNNIDALANPLESGHFIVNPVPNSYFPGTAIFSNSQSLRLTSVPGGISNIAIFTFGYKSIFKQIEFLMLFTSNAHWARRIYISYIDELNGIYLLFNYYVKLAYMVNGVETVVQTFGSTTTVEGFHLNMIHVVANIRLGHSNIGNYINVIVNGRPVISNKIPVDIWNSVFANVPTDVAIATTTTTDIYGLKIMN